MEKEMQHTVGAQTLLRGLAVIDAVAAGYRDLKSISEFTSMPRSTAHRLASALVEKRYLRYATNTGYDLGPRLIELGARALDTTSLPALARPWLQKLADATKDTVHLGIRENDEVLYLEKINSQRGLEMRSRPGHRMPLTLTGIGKALLLNDDPDAIHELFLRQGHVQDLERFQANMQRYVLRGYAFDLEENEPTIRCVAAPIYDARNQLIAAISVASTATYMSRERMDDLIPLVQSHARAISAELGWAG
ncbi:IclR family transcriptional regulator [Klebsiella indica]|uniref:HTH-type transcriptional repressor AllR n=1 Tax=Klebsiella indica TaxID=2582917 RepID=A0A5R9LEC5_9ENTR|nr:IclR family transcriptional regulator [Klebsiella indica]